MSAPAVTTFFDRSVLFLEDGDRYVDRTMRRELTLVAAREGVTVVPADIVVGRSETTRPNMVAFTASLGGAA